MRGRCRRSATTPIGCVENGVGHRAAQFPRHRARGGRTAGACRLPALPRRDSAFGESRGVRDSRNSGADWVAISYREHAGRLDRPMADFQRIDGRFGDCCSCGAGKRAMRVPNTVQRTPVRTDVRFRRSDRGRIIWRDRRLQHHVSDRISGTRGVLDPRGRRRAPGGDRCDVLSQTSGEGKSRKATTATHIPITLPLCCSRSPTPPPCFPLWRCWPGSGWAGSANGG